MSLLPCPLCGSLATVAQTHDGAGGVDYLVVCDTDDCLHGPARETHASAITAWNRRAPNPEVERLQDQVAELKLRILHVALESRRR